MSLDAPVSVLSRDSGDRLIRLIDRVYAAPGGAEGWPQFLEEVRRSFNASAAHFFSYSLATRESSFTGGSSVGSTTLSPDLQREYTDDWARVDPWVDNAVTPALPTGSIATGEQLVPTRTFRRTAFYNDFSRRIDVAHVLINMTEREPHVVSALSINGPGRRGPFSEADARLLKALSPHIQRALQVHRRLLGAETAAAEREAALDRLSHGVIRLDGSGRVTFANRAAAEILQARDGLTLDKHELRAADARGTAQLRRAVEAALETPVRPGTAPGQVVALGRPSGRRPLSVVVAPSVAGAQPGGPLAPGAMLFVTDPQRVPQPSDGQLRTLFGLTPAEARLAAGLLTGESLDQVADRLGITRNTARTHLRQVFTKTGTRRQAELVRRLAPMRPSVD